MLNQNQHNLFSHWTDMYKTIWKPAQNLAAPNHCKTNSYYKKSYNKR